MFKVSALFESGIDDFLGNYEAEIDSFALSMTDCVLAAGVAAVEEMQSNHPYTDRTLLLTSGMSVTQFGRQSRWQKEAAVVFAAPYAKFVNDGTVKSKPYPFVPQGLQAAEKKLDLCVGQQLDIFCERMARGG